MSLSSDSSPVAQRNIFSASAGALSGRGVSERAPRSMFSAATAVEPDGQASAERGRHFGRASTLPVWRVLVAAALAALTLATAAVFGMFASDGAPAPVTEPSEASEMVPWPKPAFGSVRRSGSVRPHRRRLRPLDRAKRGERRRDPSSPAGGRSGRRLDPAASSAPSPSPAPESATTPPIRVGPAPVSPLAPPPPAHRSEPGRAAPRPVPLGAPPEFM
jgi:hypothetical protein